MTAPHIQKLALRNFRGIIRGELELAPLTILVGPNNSGKTTVLEALLLAHGFREIAGVDPADILSSVHATLDSGGLAHLVYSYGAKAKRAVLGYKIRDAWAYLVVEVNSMLKFYLVRKAENVTIEKLINASQRTLARLGKEIAEAMLFSGSTKRYYFLREEALVHALMIRYDLLKRYLRYAYDNWQTLTNSGITSQAAEWISKALGEEYIDVLAEPFGGKPSLQLYRADKTRIRLGDLGDGAQMLLVAKMLIDLLKPDLILWDDIEAHMNPRMLNILALMISDLVDMGKQVIITTHSLEATETIAKVVERAKIIRLELINGELRTKYYNADKIEELKKLGIDIRA